MKFNFAAVAATFLAVAAKTEANTIPAVALTAQDKHKRCYAYPDPHFLTFHGVYYDFHGGCDVVLLKSAGFRGVGLEIHIRTEPMGWWSNISNAVIRIGKDKFELQKDNTIWINGVQNPGFLQIGAFKIHKQDWTNAAGVSGTHYHIYPGDGQWIRFTRWINPVSGVQVVAVYINAHGSDFGDSRGMCGRWDKTWLTGRDGIKEFNPAGLQKAGKLQEFGNEWQVREDEGNLFQLLPFIQYPYLCAASNGQTFGKRQGRRLDGVILDKASRSLQEAERVEWDMDLVDDTPICEEGEGCITDEEAREMCKDVAIKDMLDECVDDVRMTQDAMMAHNPIFEPPQNSGAGGDPHFHTFSGEFYAYHGVCDLVMVQSSNFAGGLGLDLHIRTEAREGYSSISNVAVRIGNELLEIINDGSHAVDGVSNAELPHEIAGFPLTKKAASEDDLFLPDVNTGFQKHEFAEAVLYEINLGYGESIQIKRWKDYLWVNVLGGNVNFSDAKGLMGSWGNPGKFARDGVTKMDDPNEFGEEWQVLSSEPKLFLEQRYPQHPVSCLPAPSATVKRRLGASKQAEAACKHVAGPKREFCVFDVVATGDVGIAAVYR